MKPFCLYLLVISWMLTPPAHAGSTDWVEARSPHFVVMTDSNAKQAVHLADQFERMRAVFHSLFPKASVDAPSPILVIAVKDRKGFQALEPQAYLAKGQLNLAGLFLRTPDKNYILLRLDGEQEHPLATVYHEYTHFMLREDAAWLPLWLNEGLASFFQNTEIHDKDVDLGKPNADDILYLREKPLVPLPVIFKVDHESPYYHDEQKGSVFYAESWALVHYLQLSDNKNHTHRISDYAELLIHHEDPVTAATQAFGDLKRLQSDLNGYVARSSFSYFRTAAPPLVDPSTFQVRPLTLVQADARRADFLAYNGRTADAQSLLNAVLREDPNNASAFETLGYMALQKSDQATARQWLTKAVAADSDSYLTHYYFAILSISEGGGENAAQVETSLKKAIELNGAFAPSYDALASFYARRHEHLTEAHLLNAQAIQRDPANLQFRIDSARVLMTSDRLKDAERVLNAAAEVAQTAQQKASLNNEKNLVEEALARQQAPAQSAPSPGTFTMVSKEAASTSMTVSQPAAPAQGASVPRLESQASGRKKVANGVLHVKKCNPVTGTLALQLESSGEAMSLTSSNYWKVEFSAENYTPKGEIEPCIDLEGSQGTVLYAEAEDKSAAGEILAIQLRH